jgi:peptide subunit release factor 1 (eRF1)
VGPDDEIERNAPGGWAQPRYQRRAEDSWRHNAAAVAEAAIHALRRVNAELLLVAGDVRAVQLLEDRLHDHSGPRIAMRHVPGGRQPDGSTPIRRAAIAQELAGYAAERMADVLQRFENERRPHGRAVEGAAETLAALAAGRADALIIVDDLRDARTAWYGPDVLGVDNRFRAAGADAALRSGRLVDIAVRAALLTDADVIVIDAENPAAPAERIGAICRYE